MYDWGKLKKMFEEKLEKAVPDDLKEYTGLIEVKGYCSVCKQKKVLFLNRASKKMFCIDCGPCAGYEFTAIEFNDMWELAQEILFYTNETINELLERLRKYEQKEEKNP